MPQHFDLLPLSMYRQKTEVRKQWRYQQALFITLSGAPCLLERQLVWRLATAQTFGRSNPLGVRVFHVPSDRPRGPHFLQYEYRVFVGGKAAEAWCWPPTHLYRRCCECVAIYLRFLSVPAQACHGLTFTFTFLKQLHSEYKGNTFPRNVCKCMPVDKG
jgi:hypothetical protein